MKLKLFASPKIIIILNFCILNRRNLYCTHRVNSIAQKKRMILSKNKRSHDAPNDFYL